MTPIAIAAVVDFEKHYDFHYGFRGIEVHVIIDAISSNDRTAAVRVPTDPPEMPHKPRFN